MSQLWKKVKTRKPIFMVLFVALVLLSIPNGTSAQVPNSQVIMSDVRIDIYLEAEKPDRLSISANVTNRGTTVLDSFDVNIDLKQLTLISATVNSINTTASVVVAERSSYIHITPVSSIVSLSSVYLELEVTSDELQEQYQICDERNLCLSSMIYYIRPVNEFTDLTFTVTLPPHAVLDYYTNPIHPEPTRNHTDGYSMVFTWETGPVFPDDAVVFIIKYGVPVYPEVEVPANTEADLNATTTLILVAVVATLGGAVIALGIERVPNAVGNMRTRRLIGGEGVSKQEREVIRLLSGKGGSCLQREIYEELDMSQSMVSMLLTGLEERGLIKRLREGRENVIHLIEE